MFLQLKGANPLNNFPSLKVTFTFVFFFEVFSCNYASAESFKNILAHTYQNNSDILAAKLTLDRTLEETPTAWSNFLPSVSLSTSFSRSITDDAYAKSSSKADTGSSSVSLSQDIVNFAYNEQFNKAKYNIIKQREQLRSSVQQVLFDAIKAYLDVSKNRDTLILKTNNLNVLKAHLKNTEALFEIRRSTKADLAQARSRVAQGNADLTSAKVDLNIANSKYRRIIGLSPENVLLPLFEIEVPKKLLEAERVALNSHPDILSANASVDAAKSEIKMKRDAFKPTLSLSGSITKSHSNNKASASSESVTSSVGLELTIPIFQKGVEYADVRLAKKSLQQAVAERESARLIIIDNTLQSWEEIWGAESKIKAYEAQVNAAETAAKGISQELVAGRRTLSNLLDSEQELLNARVNLNGAKHDYLIARFKFAKRVGKLNPASLKLVGLN